MILNINSPISETHYLIPTKVLVTSTKSNPLIYLHIITDDRTGMDHQSYSTVRQLKARTDPDRPRDLNPQELERNKRHASKPPRKQSRQSSLGRCVRIVTHALSIHL